MKTALTLAFASLTAMAAPAAAQSDAEPYGGTVSSGYHRHDGFFLRFMLGPSAVAAVADDAAETSVSGAGGALGIALGYAIAPNVILYGEIFDNIALSPTIENEVMETELSDETAFGLVGIGPGIAVYLPHNFYLSSTVAFARLVIDPDTEEDDDEATSDLGVAVTAAVGKEWWVSKNWGLGLALQLYGGAMKDGAEEDEGEDVTWSAGGALLAFSATLN